MPLREGLIFMRNALVGCGFKEDIRLAASGKVHSGAGLAVNCALGADWSNAARAFMFSLGCVQSLKCHTGECPTGIATQDPGRQRGLRSEEHTSELQSLMRISYAVFCLKKKQRQKHNNNTNH